MATTDYKPTVYMRLYDAQAVGRGVRLDSSEVQVLAMDNAVALVAYRDAWRCAFGVQDDPVDPYNLFQPMLCGRMSARDVVDRLRQLRTPKHP